MNRINIRNIIGLILLFVLLSETVGSLGGVKSWSIAHFSHTIDFKLRAYLLYEYRTRELLCEIISRFPEPRTVIDAGAHTGDTSIPIAVRHPSLEVIAVEPSADKIEYLNRLKQMNQLKNLRIIHAGIGAELSSGSIEKNHKPFNSSADKVVSGDDFPIIRLDSLKYKHRVGLIHLDVEGMEYQALVGAEAILRRDHPELVIEVVHSDEQKIDDYLTSLGYQKQKWRTARDQWYRWVENA